MSRCVGIIGAMAEEVAAFRQLMTMTEEIAVADVHFYIGSIHDVNVVLAQSGIGKVNAAMTTTLLCDRFQPIAVINTGSAGGFVSDLQKVGDIVVSTHVVHHDVDVTVFGYAQGQVPGMPELFSAEHSLIELAYNTLTELSLTAHRGMVASGDKFMTKDHHIAETRAFFPDLHAVEMEGAAIAQICHRFGVPFVVVRALSDIAGQESPMSFEQFLPLAAENAAQLILAMLPKVEASISQS